MQRLKYKFIIFMIAAAILPVVASAANLQDAFKAEGPLDRFKTGAGYEGAAGDETLMKTVGTVIQAFLSVLGIIFLGLTIYGGFTWMLARGNESKVEQAMGTIRMAIVGLVIILAAYAISVFILTQLSKGTLEPG